MTSNELLDTLKNRKVIFSIMSILFLSVVLVLAFMAAYFFSHNDSEFENEFKTGKYQVVMTEENFTPQENWLPGETQDKDIYISNKGTLNSFVRVRYEESWTDGANTITDDYDSVNKEWTYRGLLNNDYWQYNDGYYYYRYILKPGESVQILDSISLSSSVTNISSGFNYANADYKLKFIEEDLLAEPLSTATTEAAGEWSATPSVDGSGVITWDFH